MLTAIAASAGFAATAAADVKIVVTKQTYDISGITGEALIRSMNRNGPRHGFLSRAIAQTSYTKGWDIDFVQAKRACHIQRANGTLKLKVTLPRVVSTLPPGLDKDWERFLAGVRKHEDTHGDIAAQMMAATEKSLVALAVPNDPGCSKTRREASRRIDVIYDQYEDRQNAFDASEHREGGRVEYLVEAFVKS
ncbi:DUF922 domain-containing protein [Mesorhizobium sp. ES1-1]|uniref:DUF922 domain-containing protein n=1 Tax=Mesorhizobium sp. ES1-1 TaxID=2876629 RepID=UPI001CCD8D14|nr:DUF922 domain-containing protein [Mesorhizobium sp. ES1-1]MBZ9674831.1 DUF922 domain-containing protein [Mesorhizobium sp. ES1-1]